MKKTVIYSTAIIIIGLVILYNMGLYPFVVFQDRENSSNYSVNINDENKPFQQIDFDNGEYKAFVVIAISDVMNLPVNIPRYRVLKTTDKKILNQLKNCEFISSGGDVATVESRIYILRDNSLIYESGLVLDNEYEGIQNKRLGWAESKQKGQLTKIISQFTKELKPIVFLQ